jgi:hypothetical protein
VNVLKTCSRLQTYRLLRTSALLVDHMAKGSLGLYTCMFGQPQALLRSTHREESGLEQVSNLSIVSCFVVGIDARRFVARKTSHFDESFFMVIVLVPIAVQNKQDCLVIHG